MKYTILPPQKAPKQVTAHRHAPSLGEHRQAFMNRHNQRGWIQEPESEQPESDAMMALAATLLLSNRKAGKSKRAKVLKTNQLQQQFVARARANDIDSDIFRKPVKAIIIPSSPMDEFMQARASRKVYDIAVTTPLCDAEYRARRARGMGNPTLDQYPETISVQDLLDAIDFKAPSERLRNIFGTHMHYFASPVISQTLD